VEGGKEKFYYEEQRFLAMLEMTVRHAQNDIAICHFDEQYVNMSF